MFVKSQALDVVPRGGLVAKEALVDFGLLHSGFFNGDHLKVHPEVAGRGLITLGTIRGGGSGMFELIDRPFGGATAGGAVGASPVAGGAKPVRLLR